MKISRHPNPCTKSLARYTAIALIAGFALPAYSSVALAETAPTPSAEALTEAKQLLSNGDTKEAVSILETAREEDPEHFDLCMLLVEAYDARSDEVSMLKMGGIVKKMKRTVNDCLALQPDNEDAQVNVIMFHILAPGMMGGEKDIAAQMINELIKENPMRGNLLKAELALSKKDYADALSYVKIASELDPNDAEPHLVAGSIFEEQEKYDEAVSRYEQCVSIDQEAYDCWYRIGRIATITGKDAEKGIEAFKVFIQNATEDRQFLAYAHYRLAELLISTGDEAKAREHLQQAIDIGDLKPAQKLLKKLKRADD